MGYKSTNSMRSATHAMVVAAKNAGKDKIVEVMFEEQKEGLIEIVGTPFHCNITYFEFQKTRYNFDDKMSNFVQLCYPESALPIEYLNYQGYNSAKDIVTGLSIWKKNEFDIPMPSFFELYMVNVM